MSSRIAKPNCATSTNRNAVTLKFSKKLENVSNSVYLSLNEIIVYFKFFNGKAIINRNNFLNIILKSHETMRYVNTKFPKSSVEARKCVKYVFRKNRKLPDRKSLKDLYKLDLCHMPEYHVRFICIASGNFANIRKVLAKRAKMMEKISSVEDTVLVPSDDQVVSIIPVHQQHYPSPQSNDKPKPVLVETMNVDESDAVEALIGLSQVQS